MRLNLSSPTSAEDDDVALGNVEAQYRDCRGCRGQCRGCRGSEDDVRGRDAFVGVREAAELGVAAAGAPGQHYQY